MLHIYFVGDKLPNLKFVDDPNVLYYKTKIEYNKPTRLLFNLIEKGELCEDCQYYVDRFGSLIERINCSMGLKIALCVLYNPDIIVNGVEMGAETVDILAAICKDGHIVINKRIPEILNCGDREVDCEIHGFRYKGVPN